MTSVQISKLVQEDQLTRKRNILTSILQKGDKMELQSAVGIVFNESGELLLGLAIADDERDGKWVFPGGGIDGEESCINAAVREVYEETGITAIPLSTITIVHPAKPIVGFNILKCGVCTPIPNEEFHELRFFPLDKLPKETLTLNLEILSIINNSLNSNVRL